MLIEPGPQLLVPLLLLLPLPLLLLLSLLLLLHLLVCIDAYRARLTLALADLSNLIHPL